MRLFTGIAIGPNVLDNLARVLKEMRPLAPLNWSPVENLHITSKFIGQWPEARLMELEEALEKLDSTRAFDVTIARFGYFPNPHRPHALFAGVPRRIRAGRTGEAESKTRFSRWAFPGKTVPIHHT